MPYIDKYIIYRPLQKMKLEKLNLHIEPDRQKKSNIYVYVELSRLIRKLETEKQDIRDTLVNQAAYFHLINPKDLSIAIASDWLSILNFIGFDGSVGISDAKMTKAPIREKVSQFTQSDIEKLMAMLHNLQTRLETELSD